MVANYEVLLLSSRYLVSLSNSAAASDLTAALSETPTVNLGSDQLRKQERNSYRCDINTLNTVLRLKEVSKCL